jgi:hypothetical protein
MLRDADTAMYRAKVGSGGGYVVFEPSMYTAALERIDFEGALHGAVARGEMHLDTTSPSSISRKAGWQGSRR